MTAGPARLTVALPTCDGARHLAATLRSILSQDAEFDLLLVDDRSTDDTLAIARDLAGDRLQVMVNSERLGLAGNWNACVGLSQSAFVAIVHQDDLLRPGHLRSHGEVAANDPSVGLIASAAVAIDSEGQEIPPTVIDPGGCGSVDRHHDAGAFLPHLLVSNPLRCSAVTLNRSSHQASGGFDPSFRYVVDWEFWARMARRYPVVWLAAPTVAFRWHPRSETLRFRHGTADLDEVAHLTQSLIRDQAGIGSAGRALRRTADRRLARAYLNRAYQAAKSGEGHLVRRCLARSIRLAPSIVATIARDPRLAARLAIGMGAIRSTNQG